MRPGSRRWVAPGRLLPLSVLGASIYEVDVTHPDELLEPTSL